MGFADRDYYRNAPPRRSSGLPNFRTWSVTYWLIAINAIVFLLEGPITHLLGEHWSPTELGYFSTYTAILHLQLWRFITFQFLHANAEHIVFNMMGLDPFGQLIESVLGPRRYLAFYLLCGIAGPLSLMLLEATHVIAGSIYTPLIGASAGIFGLLAASAIVAPNVQIIVLVFPMRIRTAALLMMAYAAYAVIRASDNYGGEAAHLGGGVLGFFLIKNISLLNFLLPRQQRGGMYVGPRRRWGIFKKD